CFEKVELLAFVGSGRRDAPQRETTGTLDEAVRGLGRTDLGVLVNEDAIYFGLALEPRREVCGLAAQLGGAHPVDLIALACGDADADVYARIVVELEVRVVHLLKDAFRSFEGVQRAVLLLLKNYHGSVAGELDLLLPGGVVTDDLEQLRDDLGHDP